MSGFQNYRAESFSAVSVLQRVGASETASIAGGEGLSTAGTVLRFGIFELDTRTLELRRDGLLIHLRHKPVHVLRFLLERAGNLVTRAQITNEIWPNDIDIDVEQGLNHCIKEIRAALNDRAECPRYIQTLPRRGYRVVVDVRDVREARAIPASVIEVPRPDEDEDSVVEVRRGPKNFE